jgi:uncharacterized RDD family membrane protein YckC
MSYGSTPPPGDDRPDPTSSPDEPGTGGYGTPPPPPPQYGAHPADAPPPPAPGYGQVPPPPPPPPPAAPGYGQAPPPPAPEYGQAPGGYGQAPGGYGQAPPPPAYEQPAYGAAPSYTGPYEQSGQVGTLAQWPQRALGWLIDFVALAIPGWILYSIGGPKVDAATGATTAPNLFYYLGVLYFLALSIYNRWYRGGTTGQTIGRGVAGVKLVKEATGQPIGPGMAFVRDLAHIVDSIICYVGWLFPLWDSKRQTIADKIMSTVVLAEPQAKR